MDEILAALGPLGGLGFGGGLVAVIALLLRSNHQDRAQYANLRKDSELEHDADILELRERLHEAEDRLEAERERRFAAEEEAARLRVQLHQQRLTRGDEPR